MGASASTLYTQGGSWGLKFVPTYDLMEQVIYEEKTLYILWHDRREAIGV